MKGRSKYLTSGGAWITELFLVFVLGFLAATVLWLGLWFFQTRPAQAAAVQEKESALEKCLAATELCDQTKAKFRTEKEELDRKLKQALAGWGRCIREGQNTEGAGAVGQEGE